MVHLQTAFRHFKGTEKQPETPAGGAHKLPSRLIDRSSESIAASVGESDPYAEGYEAGEDLDNPKPCRFRDGLSARLWRNGFNARIQEHIARRMSAGGLHASLCD
ncbi:hypothetical protein [Ramlibacter sp. AN1133]|uniref:hypothetical protein n=1 Tax=Ramlibacter sp. AN1133 TaxID=3133429 RepID=UPI0030BF5DCA